MTTFEHLAPPKKQWWWRKSKPKSSGFVQVQLLAGLIAFAVGFAIGGVAVSDHYDSAALKAERQAHQQYLYQVARGNALAARLATSETQIRNIATWKAKNVKNHTTGRPCLSTGAVGLLNAGAEAMPEKPSTKLPEDAAGVAATDTDVLGWQIEAKERYSTCAARINAAIDYENGKK